MYLVPQGRQSQVAGTDRAYSCTGGAFDGEYVPYVPSSGQGVAVRFDAKTPPSMPSSYKGSFF